MTLPTIPASSEDSTTGAGTGVGFTPDFQPDQRAGSWVTDFQDTNYANTLNAPGGSAAVAGVGETFTSNCLVRTKLGQINLNPSTLAVYRARVGLVTGSSKCYFGFISYSLAGTTFPGSAPKGVYLERDTSDNLILHINDGTNDRTQDTGVDWPGDGYHDIVVYASGSDLTGAGSVWGSIDGVPFARFFHETSWPSGALTPAAGSASKDLTISLMGRTHTNREAS